MRRMVWILAIAISACSQANDADPSQPANVPNLEQAWIATGFAEPEGVATDGDFIYISNVVGTDSEKDGQGWISRLSMQGEVLEEKWIDGLNAPMGMGVSDGKLFVADIDSVHVINIANAEIENTIDVKEAGSLNDITVWDGDVYVSSPPSSQILKIDDRGSQSWIKNRRLRGVNGLTADGDRLLVATMRSGSLFEASKAGDLNRIATGMKNADGIAALDDGSFLVSSWPGQIWYVDGNGKVSELENTEEIRTNQNDLTRVDDLIIVPNWQPGTVTAWRLSNG